MKQTIREVYPKYLQTSILKLLKRDNIISDRRDLLTEIGEALDISEVSEVSESEQLIYVLENDNKVLKKIEENEYHNAYKYSTLFKVNELPKGKIESLEELNKIQTFSVDSEENDILFKDHFSDIIPTKFENEEVIILKFSRVLTGYLAAGGDNRRTVKTPILVVFFKDFNVVEIRFDKVKGFLKNNDEYFYPKQVTMVKEWLEENLEIELEEINLSPIIEYISNLEDPEVNVSAQAMNLRTGAKAVLDAGENDQYVLPLLGELKGIIKANEELFIKNEHTLNIKDILENFIFETEESSDLPWISLTWRNGTVKSKAVKVKFSFNFMGQEYTLLQYYGNNSEMERMNNVTRYIIENKRVFEQEEYQSECDSKAN
ncbi:hypothetical protein [Bacillus toyonensis]|uniref:hypothetical protein n=1 Tax=Bacillus toyonensis TaxID=155322 RepID=UPI00115607FE|nr:hypothetical protein [Bacillus toyonensis]